MDLSGSCRKEVETSDRESEISRGSRTPRNKEPPVGILRLDIGKPRRSSVEFKYLSQVEPSSPQPSIDRLSVTFAEDSVKSDLSTKCNLFNLSTSPVTMEKVHFPPPTDEENSDDEDYSASVTAIMQRRASTNRSKRRMSRRTSSPFSPDILPGAENGRRRSSCYTTSSGDTAITMDDNISAVTQEQIFENIRLHKEVLSNVKMQPWPMRKKLRLVNQAKSYVKKHEGVLQERLAQSRSTKDILARWNIYWIKKWQHIKREAANLSNWVIPWELRIKEIESHFGSVVASYFTFLRWLFWVNLVTSIILIAFVAVPETNAAFQLHLNNIDNPHISHFSFEIYSAWPIFSIFLYNLFFRHNATFQLHLNNIDNLRISHFVWKFPSKFIVHGLLDDKETLWVKRMSEVMGNTSKWNVIVVDWSPLAHIFVSDIDDISALVGDKLGNFTNFLIKATESTYQAVHYISHGVGAKVVAHAALNIKNECRRKVGRITALDPVKNFWKDNNTIEFNLYRLTYFADVIHTDGNGFGLMKHIGHIDYYPNGGKDQPSCSSELCDHLKACEYWTRSILNPNIFKAYSYKSWDDYLDRKLYTLKSVPMGINANSIIPKGNYFLETRFN